MEVRNFLIPLSYAFASPKILGFLFLRKIAYSGERIAKNLTSENRWEFIR